MQHHLIMAALLAVSITACGNDSGDEPTDKIPEGPQRNACDLLGKDQVEMATGLVINNVVLKDHGVFSTCNFETDRWEDTIGLIYFPGLGTPLSAKSLAEQVRQDLERDGMDYANLEEDSSIGDAAVCYQTDDGKLFTIVAHRGGHRVIISAGSREAASTMARAALSSTK